MTGTRLPLALATLIALHLTAPLAAIAASTDELRREARAAASAGQGEAAVLLYDRLLLADPDDLEALTESAQQLSWLERYDVAIERYEAVLAREPDNRFALLERAKVLGWSRRYEESADGFRTLLAQDSDDHEARLGLARVLSWSGRLEDARNEYLVLLDLRPGDVDATVGLAQTYAWAGDLDSARRHYDQAVGLPGDSRSAEVGLAYLDLWEGAVGRSLAAARSLTRRYPDDGDVRELARAARKAAAPWISAGWDVLEDSDDNRLATARIEAGIWLPPGVRTRVAYSDYDVRTLRERGGIRSLQAHGEWLVSPGHRLEAMLGVDRFDRPGRDIEDVLDWGLTYRFALPSSWGGWAGVKREPYRYSVPLIDNRVVVDALSAGLSGRAGDHWWMSGQASAWKVSDGNRRGSADASARRRWTPGEHSLDAGGLVRWVNWRDDPGSGYFAPGSFLAAGLLGRASGPVATALALDYDVYVEAGLQSFDYRGTQTSSDPFYLLIARLGWDAGTAARLELFGEAGSYASEGPEDWRYFRAGARFVWRFGVHP